MKALKDPNLINDIIFINKAKKAESIVIMHVEYFINEANRQLSNTEFYIEIPNKTTETNRKKVNKTIDDLSVHLIFLLTR